MVCQTVFPGLAPAGTVADHLAALGLARVVGEQVDPEALWSWTIEGFACTSSSLTPDDIANLLLHIYRPSPVLSPWNGGSGFFPADNHEAISWVEESTDSRLEQYRDDIATARQCLLELGLTAKPSKEAKPELLRLLRSRLSDDAVLWIDACWLDEERPSAWLGTGGNLGRYEWSRNFMLSLARAWRNEKLLLGALLGLPCIGLADGRLGNLSLADQHNPWSLVLAVEGLLAISPSASVRLTERPSHPPWMVSLEDGSGEEGLEAWLPLWGQPTTWRALRPTLQDGRLQLGARRAGSTIDAALAVATRGIDHGIESFARHKLVKRFGDKPAAVFVRQH